MLDSIWIHTGNVKSVIEFFGGMRTISELLATYVYHLVFEKSWNVVNHGIQKDRNDENTSFDIVLLDEKGHADSQEPFNSDGDGSIARSSQTYLQISKMNLMASLWEFQSLKSYQGYRKKSW